MKRVGIASLVWVAACGADLQEEPTSTDPERRVSRRGAVTLAVPESPWGWAFEVSGDADSCLETRVDGEVLGSLLPETGLRVVARSAPLQFDVQARRCTDGATDPSVALAVRAWPLPVAHEHDVVRMRLVAPSDRDLNLAALQAAIDTWLVDVGLQVRLDRRAADVGSATFEALEVAPLSGLTASSTPSEADLDVLLAGCLKIRSPVLGEAEIEAYVPRIPAGFDSNDAIFIRSTDCRSGEARPLETAALGKLIAHELGHFLGLEHVDDDNLMHPSPRRAAAQGLTPQQVDRLRSVLGARRSRP